MWRKNSEFIVCDIKLKDMHAMITEQKTIKGLYLYFLFNWHVLVFKIRFQFWILF